MSNTATALTQTELALMLAKLVCTDDRPPLWHEGTAFITDGHIGFRVENVEQPVDWALWDGHLWANVRRESFRKLAPDKLAKLLSPESVPIEFELPLIEPCESWEEPLEVVTSTCEECHGSGEVECNYGHDHECEDCDGTGKVQGFRIDYEYYSLSSKERTIKTPVGYLDRHYVWIVSRLAESRRLSYKSLSAPMLGLGFSFDGGAGLVMGIQHRPQPV